MSRYDSDGLDTAKKILRHTATKIGAGVVLGAVYFLCGINSVGNNEAGVRTVYFMGSRGVEQKTYTTGIHWSCPIFTGFDKFSTAARFIEFSDEEGIHHGEGLEKALLTRTADGNPVMQKLVLSYQIDPLKAPYIRQHVAEDNDELEKKIVLAVARSVPRIALGKMTTEYFALPEKRENAVKEAEASLLKILTPYAVNKVVISLKDWRFMDTDYVTMVRKKKIADQETVELKRAVDATVEKNKDLLNLAQGSVNKIVAEMDGKFAMTKQDADAGYERKKSEARALIEQARAQATGIRAEREAMQSGGADTYVRIQLLKAIQGARIVMVPSGGGNALNVNTMDINDILKLYGVKALSADKQAAPAQK